MTIRWKKYGRNKKRATYYNSKDDSVFAIWQGKNWRVCNKDGSTIERGCESTAEEARLAAEGALWCYGEDK